MGQHLRLEQRDVRAGGNARAHGHSVAAPLEKFLRALTGFFGQGVDSDRFVPEALERILDGLEYTGRGISRGKAVEQVGLTEVVAEKAKEPPLFRLNPAVELPELPDDCGEQVGSYVAVRARVRHKHVHDVEGPVEVDG